MKGNSRVLFQCLKCGGPYVVELDFMTSWRCQAWGRCWKTNRTYSSLEFCRQQKRVDKLMGVGNAWNLDLCCLRKTHVRPQHRAPLKLTPSRTVYTNLSHTPLPFCGRVQALSVTKTSSNHPAVGTHGVVRMIWNVIGSSPSVFLPTHKAPPSHRELNGRFILSVLSLLTLLFLTSP